MMENEEKREIIELNYVLNFHLTVYCKMVSSIMIGPNCSCESLQTAIQPPLQPTFQPKPVLVDVVEVPNRILFQPFLVEMRL